MLFIRSGFAAFPHDLKHLVPDLGTAAGCSPQSPTLLGPTSSILLAWPRRSLLTWGVVGLSRCLYRDENPGKHNVKKHRCLVKQTDSSAVRDVKTDKGKWRALETLVRTSVLFSHP